MPIAEKDLTGLLVCHDDQGREFGPIACGVHRSVEVGQASGAEGFDPKCEDCQTQLGHTEEAIRRESMTETGIPQPEATATAAGAGELTVAELRERLREADLSVSGSKAELVARLEEAEASGAAPGAPAEEVAEEG